jgi:hypothetical protein
MYLKYTRNTTIQTPDMSPKGRRPTTRQNRAQTRGEPRTDLNQITSSLRQTHIGPLKRSKGVNPPKLGEFGLTGGAAAPRPNQTLWAAFYRLSMVDCMGLVVNLMLRMAVWSI